MSKRSQWIAALVLVAVTIALGAIAEQFGWLPSAPPLLAPGIK